jgi:glycerophosphoryl diester phosphodiesterase
MTGQHPFLDHPHPIAFAHRGGASDAPENTLGAFAAAIALGYRYLETDVHVTADGVLVAFHDDRLDRVTDSTGAIADLTWAEVREARVDGVGEISRMTDLLEAFPEARFNIDPKADGSVDPLAQLIADTGSVDRVCVGAFSDRRIARLRKALGPRLCTALGPRAVAQLEVASKGLPVGRLHGVCAQVPTSVGKITLVDKRFIDAAHKRSIEVHVWTIDEPAEMHRLLDLGVDGIMTDRPAVLRQVLMDRGQWA